MSSTEAWYVVKQPNGQCTITPANDLEPIQHTDTSSTDASSSLEHWGPYHSQQDAIARRVGLIRAGKCQPV
ncbi:MAG: hypothetical protein KME45_29750 [Stenomitos rutilans HA7619-LM2]|nr:hypothetical protein [Stenomitos rutilans HA7619-LM2]